MCYTIFDPVICLHNTTARIPNMQNGVDLKVLLELAVSDRSTAADPTQLDSDLVVGKCASLDCRLSSPLCTDCVQPRVTTTSQSRMSMQPQQVNHGCQCNHNKSITDGQCNHNKPVKRLVCTHLHPSDCRSVYNSLDPHLPPERPVLLHTALNQSPSHSWQRTTLTAVVQPASSQLAASTRALQVHCCASAARQVTVVNQHPASAHQQASPPEALHQKAPAADTNLWPSPAAAACLTVRCANLAIPLQPNHKPCGNTWGLLVGIAGDC